MIPGMNPRDMQKAMKRMGIKQVDIDATQVIIKTPENSLVIHNPQVSKINMMGQETFQISGQVEEVEDKVELSEDDIKTVMDQGKCDEAKAKELLEETNGNIAEAILKLQG